MNILSQILGGSLGQIFKDVVGQFKADPNKVLEFQAELERNQAIIQQKEQELQAKALDVEAQLNETAGKNIRAEAESGDAYVRRSRPSVIWVGLGVIIWNFCVRPMFPGKMPVELPEMFWEVWCIVATGYVFMRTGDKLLGGKGGSLSLGPLKAESKGDHK